jgi:hypothetical protein
VSIFGFKTPIPYPFGAEIGRPNDSYRSVKLESLFGNMNVIVTDGHLPYPFGRRDSLEVPAKVPGRPKPVGAALIGFASK